MPIKNWKLLKNNYATISMLIIAGKIFLINYFDFKLIPFVNVTRKIYLILVFLLFEIFFQ